MRDRLGIGYADFNAALKALGPPYRPIHNVEGHRNAFSYFKQQQRERILRALRVHFLKAFERGASLDAYVALRGMESLLPDPAWLDRCDLPEDSLMERRLKAWLAEAGVRDPGERGRGLQPIDELLVTNRAALAPIARRVCRLIRAWCTKNSAPLPALWEHADAAENQVLDLADRGGILDFRPLAVEVVLAWLRRQGQWPKAMPLTQDLPTLGLTEELLARQETEAEQQRRRAELERRTIEIGGQRLSTDPVQFVSLIPVVQGTITEAFLRSSRSLTPLAELDPRRTGTRGGAGGGARSARRPTEAQRVAIGFVGELLAFEWLKRQYPNVTPENWRSAYRNHVFGGTSGDDSLGFDFEIFLAKGKRLFEVKTSSTDRLEIELGETEVATAQRYSRGNHYRILFIQNALDSASRSIHVLPNPFSEAGRKLYRLVGTGLRYQFDLKR